SPDFFFQAEDGIRDRNVTGVQTCALPISRGGGGRLSIVENPSHNPVMERTRRNQVTVDGSQLSVDVYGEVGGPALLVVPGVLADAAAWAPVAERIEGWPAVAVVNRRGRSPSGPLTDRYGLDTEVRDAATVAESIGNVDTVFGWSYGGLIALHLADVIEVPHV